MPTPINRDEVQELHAGGAVLVDVLPPKEYAEHHLAGARSIPLRQMDADSTRALSREQPIIVYCHDFQ